MSLLPSPIPHPLDYCPWDLPGWIYEALDWVVGVEWPEGNERAVWDLADEWYGVASVLAGPHTDATTAAGEVRGGYGGVGAVAGAFDRAWHRVAEGDEAPLPVLLAVTGELGRLVESCGCDIEGAKLEVWIELGILVVELLSLAVTTVLTAGAASPAAGVAITTTRMAVQQIFKRLMAQLARKALKEGLKEASERAAKEVVKSGVRGFARRAALGGLAEAGQEAGVSLATQAYQNSTGRRHGLDGTDVGMSAVGGFAGGAVAPLAGLGRHAHGRLGRVGEHLGREMTGETLAEGAAGLATGQGASLEDLARAAVSGAGGSATGQADTALHHRLDGRMAALAGTAPPMDLGGPVPVVEPQSGTQDAGPIPAQRTPTPAADLAVPSPIAAGTESSPVTHTGTGDPHAAAEQAGHHRSVTDGGLLLGHPSPTVDAGNPPTAVGSPVDATPAHTAASPAVEVAATPTLSSVTVEPPVAASHLSVTADPSVGPAQAVTAAGATVHPAPPTPIAQATGSPSMGVSAPMSTQPIAVSPAPAPVDRSTAGTGASPPGPTVSPRAHHSTAALPADQVTRPVAAGPDTPPSPSPRFPLLEALAPGPPRPTHDASPELPGPFDPLPPRPRTPDPDRRAAQRAADREGLDRRRHQGYFEAQREWYEDKRRHGRVKELREAAERHYEATRWLFRQARELEQAGQHYLAEQHMREGRLRERLYYQSSDMAEAVLDGSVVPEHVTVDDDADFHRINDDVAGLAPGAVETSDRSALSGDDGPPPIERSRRYGIRGGLRPPLALHQTDLERQMPRNVDGSVLRTADPRHGGWFRLANDGGPQADPTRGINCLDCTLSLYETWVHGRPRVSAPRTFDSYQEGDVRRPTGGEWDGPRRVEESTGGRFQKLCEVPEAASRFTLRQQVEQGYRDLHEQLLVAGHGSYAFLITSWEGGGSHAWVALNQNGTVLYLDPQNGDVANLPLYTHRGVAGETNVVGIDALVLGRDGAPMPLAGRPPGDFNALPGPLEPPAPPPPPAPLPPPPDDVPDFNHVYLLGEPGGVDPTGAAPPAAGRPEPDPADLRRAHRDAHADRIAAGLFLRDAIAVSVDLDEVFAAGVTPVELADHLDAPTLRRLAPDLDEAAARDVTRLLSDPGVRQMLDQAWEAPPRGEPMLAETLVRQLAQRPDLARMILAAPELANSLTARPMTLHHLASHQQAIDVLGEVLDDIAVRGAAAVAVAPTPPVLPTPLTTEQLEVSSHFDLGRRRAFQPGFDRRRRGDMAYRREYLDQLYEAAAAGQIEIDALGRRLAESSHGRAEYRPRPEPKDRQRAEDKVANYNGDASRLKDLAAGRVSYQRLPDLYAALSMLKGDSEVAIVQFEDRFLKPQESGYRDVQMMMRTSSGHVAEFRLQLAALDEVATWEHALFEVRRDLEAVAVEQGRSVSEKEAAIRKGIIQRQRGHFWAALQSTLNGGRS